MELIDKEKLLEYLIQKVEWYLSQSNMFPMFYTEIATCEQIIEKIESGEFDIKEPIKESEEAE